MIRDYRMTGGKPRVGVRAAMREYSLAHWRLPVEGRPPHLELVLRGQRRLKTAANAEAKTRRKEVGREGFAFGVMAEGEKAAVEFWRGFMAEVADTPPPPLLAILQGYAETWKANRSNVTVSAAVAAYEAAKTSEGSRPPRRKTWLP